MNINPAFLSALKAGDMDLLCALHQANPRQLYGKTVKGNSVVHIAASYGNIWAFQAFNLLDIDILLDQNAKGDTALHCAAQAGQDNIVAILTRHHIGALMTGMLNDRGDAALHEAARAGHVNAVWQLVAFGPEMAAVVNREGESPLYLAAARGSVEAVRMLLGCPTVEYGGPQGQTALHAAVCRSHDIAKMLLKKMPELNKQVDASQSAPIHYAACLGDVSMVRTLLQGDALVAHLLDNHGLSAIHIAASKDYANVVEEIIHHCPDAIELTDIEGQNFLHAATKKRAVAVVKLVLSNPLLRKSINETENEGNTPLHLAVMNHSREIVHLLLLDSRVDPNVINRKGLTPLDVASSCANSNIRLRMNKILKELTSAGSKFGPHRMDLMMGKDQRRPEEELNRYRILANNLAIVAVLIATVTFAAAFTLPGGYNNDYSNQEQGMAILANKLAFKVFLISDTIAMVSSICVTCLLIFTGSMDHDIRLHSIIIAMKFMWFALGGMVVAFSMGIYVVVVSKCRLLAFLICGMTACVPFIAWMIAYWPTFGSIKLVQKNTRNRRSIKRITSILKFNLHLPNCMVVDFVTPANSMELESLIQPIGPHLGGQQGG